MEVAVLAAAAVHREAVEAAPVVGLAAAVLVVVLAAAETLRAAVVADSAVAVLEDSAAETLRAVVVEDSAAAVLVVPVEETRREVVLAVSGDSAVAVPKVLAEENPHEVAQADSEGGGQGGAASAPSRSQLNGFLGMPSDEGMSHGGQGAAAGAGYANRNSSDASGAQGAAAGAGYANRNSPDASGAQSAAAGAAAANRNSPDASGAQGAAAGAAAANRNSPEYSGAQGAAAGAAAANRNSPEYSGAQGAAAGAAAANRNSPNYSGSQGAAVGYAAGFSNVAPSARYGTATAVRGNFNNYGMYGAGWNTDHPGAWAAADWGANDAWRAATWNSAGAWCGYNSAAPIYYDFGNNVTYQDNEVYVNGQDSGSSSQYYDQASALATTGAQAEAPRDGDWLPLGVFAFSKEGAETSNVTIQLAVNKQGIIRGNSTETSNQKTETVSGSVDKQTQRIAFTIGSVTTTVVETGLYNLTKDDAPALVHFGQDRTEQWLLVRLKNDGAQQ